VALDDEEAAEVSRSASAGSASGGSGSGSGGSGQPAAATAFPPAGSKFLQWTEYLLLDLLAMHTLRSELVLLAVGETPMVISSLVRLVQDSTLRPGSYGCYQSQTDSLISTVLTVCSFSCLCLVMPVLWNRRDAFYLREEYLAFLLVSICVMPVYIAARVAPGALSQTVDAVIPSPRAVMLVAWAHCIMAHIWPCTISLLRARRMRYVVVPTRTATDAEAGSNSLPPPPPSSLSRMPTSLAATPTPRLEPAIAAPTDDSEVFDDDDLHRTSLASRIVPLPPPPSRPSSPTRHRGGGGGGGRDASGGGGDGDGGDGGGNDAAVPGMVADSELEGSGSRSNEGGKSFSLRRPAAMQPFGRTSGAVRVEGRGEAGDRRREAAARPPKRSHRRSGPAVDSDRQPPQAVLLFTVSCANAVAGGTSVTLRSWRDVMAVCISALRDSAAALTAQDRRVLAAVLVAAGRHDEWLRPALAVEMMTDHLVCFGDCFMYRAAASRLSLVISQMQAAEPVQHSVTVAAALQRLPAIVEAVHDLEPLSTVHSSSVDSDTGSSERVRSGAASSDHHGSGSTPIATRSSDAPPRRPVAIRDGGGGGGGGFGGAPWSDARSGTGVELSEVTSASASTSVAVPTAAAAAAAAASAALVYAARQRAELNSLLGTLSSLARQLEFRYLAPFSPMRIPLPPDVAADVATRAGALKGRLSLLAASGRNQFRGMTAATLPGVLGDVRRTFDGVAAAMLVAIAEGPLYRLLASPAGSQVLRAVHLLLDGPLFATDGVTPIAATGGGDGRGLRGGGAAVAPSVPGAAAVAP